jgi:GT2 family glycosyltransferase
MKEKIAVSVIVVNWNTKELLRNCLESVYAKTKDLSFEVIVADNASADGSGKMVKETFPQVILLENKQNVGFAKANNQAMKKAKGEYLFLLNSDTLLRNNVCLTLKNFLDSHPQVGAVGPHLFNQDGSLQVSCSVFPNLRQAFLNLVLQQPVYGYPPKDYDKNSFSVETIIGAALMVPRAVFEEVGGLDESYFMYSEDVDWCRRIAQKGYERWYVKEAQVIHFGGKSSLQDAARTKKDFNRSLMIYYGKYHNPLETALYGFCVWFGSTFGSDVVTLRRILKATVKWLLKLVNSIKNQISKHELRTLRHFEGVERLRNLAVAIKRFARSLTLRVRDDVRKS